MFFDKSICKRLQKKGDPTCPLQVPLGARCLPPCCSASSPSASSPPPTPPPPSPSPPRPPSGPASPVSQ